MVESFYWSVRSVLENGRNDCNGETDHSRGSIIGGINTPESQPLPTGGESECQFGLSFGNLRHWFLCSA